MTRKLNMGTDSVRYLSVRAARSVVRCAIPFVLLWLSTAIPSRAALPPGQPVGQDRLPSVSVLASTPESFYGTNPIFFWGVVALLAALTLAVAVLVYTSSIRKRAASALEEKAEELEQRVRERTLQLETANQELEAFCYSVSHDLRAPLRHVNGYSRIIMEDCGGALDNDGRQYLERICAACDRMEVLIDDLLELSLVSRSEMLHDNVSLTEIARDVVADLQRSQPERSVAVTIAETAQVTGDVRLLRVMMGNLLGNAWKYTGKRDGATIVFGEQLVDGVRVFFVKDNGAGFDMAYADKLFNPFQRLHGTEFEGSGVGLATVQRIILRHGGRIWADAAVGGGATFWFTVGDDGWSDQG